MHTGGVELRLRRNRASDFCTHQIGRKEEKQNTQVSWFNVEPTFMVMEAAAVMAIALANGGGKPPDWQDFVGIICLLVINSTISFIEENNAGNVAAALMVGLAPKTKVLGDGRWSEQEDAVVGVASILIRQQMKSSARWDQALAFLKEFKERCAIPEGKLKQIAGRCTLVWFLRVGASSRC